MTLTISPALILSLGMFWICSMVRNPWGSGGAELDGPGVSCELMFVECRVTCSPGDIFEKS